MKTKLVPKLPIVSMTTTGALSCYFTLAAAFNYIALMSGQFMGNIPSFILFGDSTRPGFWGFFFATLWLMIGWLLSTKFKRFKNSFCRRFWFWNMFFGITFHYLWLISAPVYNSILPYLETRIATMKDTSVWEAIALGDTNTLLITTMFIPTIISVGMLVWLSGQFSQYSIEIKDAFERYEIKSVWVQKYFKLEETEHWPDVVLGPESNTKELLIQPGRDRTLNNIIIGSIGTGKTAALVLPILNQDLHWMSRFINDYPFIHKRDDYETENVKGMYLNGITVIEPSNDLCQKAYQLVKAHGIPEESVFYIDPTNANTPSLNPMQGPVNKVAEAFAMVIQGLAEGGGGGNFFFEQSERNHLKHYIYLLKLHEPEQEVTFDMLLNMYNNPQLVRRMHEKLKKTFPENIDLIEDRDKRNHWAIVKQIDEWFDMNLLPKTSRTGGGTVTKKITHGKYRGEDVYYDAKAEYVQGLRNVLNDIGANPLIRRVLFGKSDFDFDRHLEMGGVLLVNSAKGELGSLSNILGKLILLSIQNAVFRRKPNVSTFHSLIVDEFPDYIYQPFREFPAQSRKYKTIVTVVAQTIAQLADKYGETYMHTLLGTLRHKMVYGDIPDFDAELFSKIFGEKERYQESVSEQNVNAMQEKPSLRMSSSFQKSKEAILSPSDIIYQKPFQCAVKIVANNEPIPVRQIDANFVPREEFEEAKIRVNEEAAEIWLKYRNQMETKVEFVEEGIEEVEDEFPMKLEIPIGEDEHPFKSPFEEGKQPHNDIPFEDDRIFREEEPYSGSVSLEKTAEIPVVMNEPDMEKQKIVVLTKENIKEKTTKTERWEKQSATSVTTLEDEIETFSFKSILGNIASSEESETPQNLVQSEIGEKQNDLYKEVLQQVKKVEAPKPPNRFGFMLDYDE